MERGDKTDSILRQFRRKSRRIVNKDIFTEFFYLNKQRKVIEFLNLNDELILTTFLKQFLPEDFREFVTIKILNDAEEEISTWFYEVENMVLVISVNWGFKKQEISLDVDMDNFIVTILDENGDHYRKVDHTLLNDYIISFITNQAKNLAQSFNVLSGKKKE